MNKSLRIGFSLIRFMAELPVKQMLLAVQPFAYIPDWMSRAGGGNIGQSKFNRVCQSYLGATVRESRIRHVVLNKSGKSLFLFNSDDIINLEVTKYETNR